MSYIGTTEIGKMFLGDVEIDKAYLGNDLVFQSGTTPLPYTPLSYLQTDGDAYIDTGIAASPPKSMEIKALISQDVNCVMLGKGNIGTSSQVASMFVLLYINGARTCFGYRYRYLNGAPSISNSITNQTPFECRCQMRNGSQKIETKQDGETSWTSLSKTQGSGISGSGNLYLFANNYNTVSNKCPSGSRVYYCKIYSAYDYTSLVFDGVPALYNGAYGLWDKVSNSFFGNAGDSGVFSGQ